MNISAVNSFQAEVGTMVTYDESPPTFTKVAFQDPTASDDRIVVTFQLNEPGTVHCRPVRSDAGRSSFSIQEILDVGWSTVFTSGDTTMEMTAEAVTAGSATNESGV